ncbi:hypothetical protein HanXRQr2_Chr04g0162521 [Helianthus annuus]|uniref:Uncharacterized protein n=1 Tax=Helianthus annuus TaxID=4232 RepID=A0A9K3J7N1_HELAN|nr:hypothetical protein HanXRQr2_Chr04g0162521 [Helianthus annuus]KAJ0931022.1 hypothetical protein HanPSC8_Chr04g0156571 [Helianthus annuus]
MDGGLWEEERWVVRRLGGGQSGGSEAFRWSLWWWLDGGWSGSGEAQRLQG